MFKMTNENNIYYATICMKVKKGINSIYACVPKPSVDAQLSSVIICLGKYFFLENRRGPCFITSEINTHTHTHTHIEEQGDKY